jgi:hypothetical protein
MERRTEYPGAREKLWSLPSLPRTESKAAGEAAASTRARSKSITVLSEEWLT